MRIAQRHLALTACAVLLVGCTTAGSGDAPGTGEPVSTTSAASATAPASAASSSGTSGATTPTTERSATPGSSPSAPATSSAAATTSGGPGTASAAADLPSEVLLPDAAFDPITGDRVEMEGPAAWALPDSCALGTPAAAAMRGVTVGSGEFEAVVGLQQVAVFPEADLAVAEADRLVAALSSCSPDAGDTQTRYLTEPVEVGAQGTGLATDYYGAVETGSGDAALGSYLAVTRRGTAVTLVANVGGESTIGVSRGEVTDRLQAAWELLCRYDSAGC